MSWELIMFSSGYKLINIIITLNQADICHTALKLEMNLSPSIF